MVEDPVSIFPDTNCMLHFPPLSQINWCSLCERQRVTLVICFQVIHELDQKKDDARLADRAHRSIKEIREYHKSRRALRDGVTLKVFNHEIRQKDFAETLSPDSKDDLIVHLVMEYMKRHPDENVAVATDDLGMELRCEAHSISVYRMHNDWRLPDPTDELSKKYKAAVTELNELKRQRPNLQLAVSAIDADEPRELLTLELSNQVASLDVDGEVDRQRDACPPMHETYGGLFGHAELLGAPMITKGQRQQYNEKLEAYFGKYAEYVEQYNRWLQDSVTVFQFRLWLSNEGNAPADDIDITVLFPARFNLLAESDDDRAQVLAAPAPPSPPERPKPTSLLGSLMPGFDPSLIRPIGLERMIRDANAPRTEVAVHEVGDDEFEIRARVPRLKHHHLLIVDAFIADFRQWEDVGPFEAPFSITAANHPDVKDGCVVFKIVKES